MLEQEKWRRLNGELGGDIDAMPPRLITIPWEHVRASGYAGFSTLTNRPPRLSVATAALITTGAGALANDTIPWYAPGQGDSSAGLTLTTDGTQPRFAPGVWNVRLWAHFSIAWTAFTGILRAAIVAAKANNGGASTASFATLTNFSKLPDTDGDRPGFVDLVPQASVLVVSRELRLFAGSEWMLALGVVNGPTPANQTCALSAVFEYLGPFDQIG